MGIETGRFSAMMEDDWSGTPVTGTTQREVIVNLPAPGGLCHAATQARRSESIAMVSIMAGLGAFLAAAVTFAGGGLGAFDFGFYWQAAHLIALGHLNPVVGAIPGHPYLSDDLETYMYPLALLFRIWPSPWLLILAQAAAFAGVVALALRYAVERHLDGAWFWAAAVLIVLYPPASDAVGGFHWDIFAGLFGLAMLLNLLRGRLAWAILFAVLTLAVREAAGFIVAAVSAFYIGLSTEFGRAQKVTLVLGLAGLAVSTIEVVWLLPLLSPGHVAFMQRSLFGNATGMADKMVAVLLSLFWPAKWIDLMQLVLPLLFLPILRPKLWPALALAISVGWLSLDINMFSGIFQYPSAYLAVLYPATVEGLLVARRARHQFSIRPVLVAPLIACLWILGLLSYANQLLTVAYSAQQVGSPRLRALATDRAIVGHQSLLTTAADYVYVGNARTTVIPSFVQGSLMPSFVRELGTRYIELSQPPYANAATGSLAPYLKLAHSAGYRLVRRAAGTTLLERTGIYRRPHVVEGMPLPVGVHAEHKAERSGWSVYEVRLPRLAEGWWQADLRLRGRGEFYLCSLDGSDETCGQVEYLTGTATRPVGLYAQPGKRNAVFLHEMDTALSHAVIVHVVLEHLRVN